MASNWVNGCSNNSSADRPIDPSTIKLVTDLHDMFGAALIAALHDRPADPLQFLARHFQQLARQQCDATTTPDDTRLVGQTRPDKQRRTSPATVPFYVVVDDELAVEPDRDSFQPTNRRTRRDGWRASVAVASYNPETDNHESRVIVHAKTPSQRRQLTQTVKQILLFRSLDEESMSRVIDAMFERKVNRGDYVIRQGDGGDNFYVIESGVYDVIIQTPGTNESRCVLRLTESGSFGELALMYEQPRTASVVAVTAGTLWAMDRESFRRIVLNRAHKKRQMYDKLLSSVPMLQALDDYERATLADALRTQVYPDGACIVRQGDGPADGMYIIEKGAARVTITADSGEPEKTVAWLRVGDYFGEMALLEDGPRTASVYAMAEAGSVGDEAAGGVSPGAGGGQVTVAFLERESFERLLGPCVDIMKRKSLTYQRSQSSSLAMLASDTHDKQ